MSKRIMDLLAARLKESDKILERAKGTLLSPLATGPFRAPEAVMFVKEAHGSKIVDYDGYEYVDVTMAYGPLILGHAHPVVVEATQEAVSKGTVYAIAHESEVRMAELMIEAIPCAERVAFANSGTEATMHAFKVARALTGRDKIAKFEGAYHGVHDWAQVSGHISMGTGPVEDPASRPETSGIPQSIVDLVLTLPYRREALDTIRKHKDELAAVVIEPMPGSFPIDISEFLIELREVTRECGVPLIFDEVVTGFRFGYSGAQGHFGVTPDMATYGKIMGGGFPAGAVVGSVEAMQPLITSGDIGHDVREKCLIIGTFSGNPVTMSAGAAVLEYLRDHPKVYARMDEQSARLKREVQQFGEENDFELRFFGIGSFLVPIFYTQEPESPRDLRSPSIAVKGAAWAHYMRYHGVYVPDTHSIFLSTVHTEQDIDTIIEATKTSLLEMRKDGLL